MGDFTKADFWRGPFYFLIQAFGRYWPVLANRLAQRGNGVSGSKANRKLVLVSTADDCSVVGIFSDPHNPIGVDKDFQAVRVFKHYELHVASFG